ncbi:MAG: UDP-N-acetylmuramate dehydrogenase [Candidatus Omnitrophica bacterium]|nr:UDP-N-acetylmuramate dehydrogenase [Candidatus Omnitrophota bacterium]
MNWLKSLKGDVKFKESLSKYTTFKIGGKVDLFVEPYNLDELIFIIREAKVDNLPLRIIGRGSNLLINDSGLKGIVIRLNSPYFKRIERIDSLVKVGAGVSLERLLNYTCKEGLGGAEFLVGIPASLGGAIIMNAGTDESSLERILEEVVVIDYNGKIKRFKNKDIRFGYRFCSLYPYIIVEATLKFVPTESEEILKKRNSYLAYRRTTQELNYPSAGCIFKNPKVIPAGKLIDLCGLKGKRIGDAQVSFKHANFIINKGRATFKDVLRLIDYIKKKVKSIFNIELEPEIKIW